MAEKKATKAAATTKKAAAPKKETVKKAAAPKATKATKAALVINAENAGFKAGDVYNALAAAGKALSVAEIAKAAKISNEEVILGAGWLLKEGKIKDAEGKIVLA
ncbi:MAG: winged helix-turn-helix domain-containing protein [Prevotella sp.]|nr:winged helix-turn-helix domain-containing protein [Prevotella sp.]